MSEQDAGEVLADVIRRLEQAERRLDKQAKAIRALREQVAESGATPSTGQDTMSRILPPTCLVCGQGKEAGRARLMTCRACSDERQSCIRAGGERLLSILTSTCGLCGGDKPKSTTIVCAPCRKRLKAADA